TIYKLKFFFKIKFKQFQNLMTIVKNFFQKKNKINFIHVPKNCGSIIIENLNVIQSYSNYKFKFYNHYFKQYNLSNDERYIISIRDPIESFISSYNQTLYPKSKFKEEKIINQKLNQKNLELFPSLNNFCESFNTEKQIYIENFIYCSIHMRERLSSFFKSIENLEKNLPIYIVEKDTFVEDMQELFEKFNVSFKFNTLQNDLFRLDYKKENLSDLAKKNLNDYLKLDYEFFSYLKNKKNEINSNFLRKNF
ncbi:hypothetical protein N9T53_01475, partial [bacterium]|nr:hypothetical protein [bacterium]